MLDQFNRLWSDYTIDPLYRDCKCKGHPECDPKKCPRFTDWCYLCKASFTSGWICMNGGDVVCEDCVSY